MKKENLEVKAMALYSLTTEIKKLTEEAEELKKELRLKMDEPIEMINGMTCKKVTNVTPILDNKKTYKRLTFDEICSCTKPILSEDRKVLDESALEYCTSEVKAIDCIKFVETK